MGRAPSCWQRRRTRSSGSFGVGIATAVPLDVSVYRAATLTPDVLESASSALDDLVRNLVLQIEALDQQIARLHVRGYVSPDQITGRIDLRAEQQEQLYYARIPVGTASGLLSILQRVELPVSPVAPRPVLNAALAVVLAITLVLLIGLLRDLLDTRPRTVDQVTSLTNLPLLAAFPVLDVEHRASREAANILRANLAFAFAQAHPKVVVATSASPAEGRTTVAVALASSFARQGYRTLLVDLDMRKPMVATMFNLGYGDVRAEVELSETEGPIKAIATCAARSRMSLTTPPARRRPSTALPRLTLLPPASRAPSSA